MKNLKYLLNNTLILVIKMSKVYIEETLSSDDVDVALSASPFLVSSEVIEGARTPLVFL